MIPFNTFYKLKPLKNPFDQDLMTIPGLQIFIFINSYSRLDLILYSIKTNKTYNTTFYIETYTTSTPSI